MNDPSRHWNEVSRLFDELVEATAGIREKRLAELSARDPSLADEIRSLLAADAAANTMLDSDAASVAAFASGLDAKPSDGMAGPYRLLRSIGVGGMGEVWLSERTDGAYEQQVAVKLLKRGMDTHAILRRFLQERQILARLHHNHIVRLVDGGMSSDDRPYYVMDFVDGQPITAYAREHSLDVRARVALLTKVADAVAYAHSQLIVHRDLKPSNVLVDSDGEPRVLDFGIAKLIEETGDGTMTGTGMRVLSPAYAAPEQILGEVVGTPADVYALGLMLYELLVGQLPQQRLQASLPQLALDVTEQITGRASAAVRTASIEKMAALYGSDAAPRQVSQQLSGDLDLIIATALQREPTRRYATAAAFADDLRRWLDRRPIAARADSTGYRLNRFVRRHRVGVAATALVLLALIGGLGAALWQADKARHQAEVAQQQTRRAERVKTLLIDIFKQSDPRISKGESLSAAEILKQGRESLETSLVDDPSTRGELLIAIAEIQGSLGQREEGVATVETGFPLFAAGMSELDPRLAHAYYVRAVLYDYASRAGDAERDLLKAQRIMEATTSPDLDQLDDVQTLLSEVISHTRSHAEAITLKEQLLEKARRRFGASHPKVARKVMHLARMHEDIGDYASAEQGYKEAMPILMAVNEGISTDACEGERNYAGLLDRMSRTGEALPHLDNSLRCSEKLYGRDSIPFARGLFHRGILFLHQSRPVEAEADFRATLQVFSDVAMDAGHSHRYLGRALLEQGRYATAADEFKTAERIYREVNLPRDSERWRARSDYGYALFKEGDTEGGRVAVEAALAGLSEVIPAGDMPEFMRPLRVLGEIARAQKDSQGALAAHRRWHELAMKNYGPDSRDAYNASYELASDLSRIGDRASLLEAQTLLVEAIRVGRQFDEPAIADYEGRQRNVEMAISKLPSQ